MLLEELKNYGNNIFDFNKNASPQTLSKVNKEGMKIVQKELGLFNFIRFILRLQRKKKEFMKKDLDQIRTFCKYEDFIQGMIESAATFAAMAEIVGEERATKIHYQVMDKVNPLLGPEIFPHPEDLASFPHPFEALKQYFLASMKTDQSLGLHFFELIEDTPTTMQVNMTKCAWFEVKRALGVPAAALPDCYGDDVFLPTALRKANIEFKRTQTIARGAKICDFRFEYLKP